MEKIIIFDFGNVLGFFDHMKACERLSSYCCREAKDIYNFAFGGEIHRQRETGLLPPEEFFQVMSKEFNFTSELTFEKFSDIWGDIFSSNESVEKLLASIGSHASFYVLSNTEALHWRYIEKLPIMQRFFRKPEQQILSFRVGARKPDKKIFETVALRTGISLGQIIYVDDVPEYVAMFRKMGGKGITFEGRKKTISFLLEQLGI